MKKVYKSLISIILIINLLFIVKVPEVKAASASITPKTKTITVGETVTVSASITGWSFNATLSGNGQTKSLTGDMTKTSNETKSASITFTPSSAGTYTFTLSGINIDYDGGGQINVNEKATITVKEKETPVTPPPSDGGSGSDNNGNNNNQNNNNNNNNNNNQNNNDNKPKNTTKPQETKEEIKSDNCFLKSLSVNQGKLSPEFDKGTKEYEIVFDEGFDFSTLTNIEISAKAEDSKASVSLPKDTAVRDGENTYLVTVYAEDSTSITYKLKLNKPEKLLDSGLRLKSLSIEQINEQGESSELKFSPEFNPDTQEYKADVEEDIKSLKVNAEAEEKVSVEIKGADSLQPGKNDIYIYLTTEESEDVVTVYKVVVDKKGEIANTVKTKTPINKTIILIVAGIVGILALLLLSLIIVNRKIKKENEDFDEDDEEEEDDEESDEIEEDIEEEKAEEYVPKGSIKEEPKEVSSEEVEETENDEIEEVEDDESSDEPHGRKKGGKRFK